MFLFSPHLVKKLFIFSLVGLLMHVAVPAVFPAEPCPRPSLIRLDSAATIQFRDFGPLAAWAKKDLQARIGQNDWIQPKDSPIPIRIAPLPDNWHPNSPEAYKIQIQKDSINIQAHTQLGILRAAETLRQLTDSSDKICLGTIEDWPAIALRGIAVTQGLEAKSFEQILQMMQEFKLNTIYWNVVDHKSWRLPTPSYSKLTQLGSRSKSIDIHQLSAQIEQARQAGVTLIPQLDLVGASSFIVQAYPQLCCPTSRNRSIAQLSKLFMGGLCSGNPGLLDFWATICTDTAEIFRTNKIHLGSLTPPTRNNHSWRINCPLCRQVMSQHQLKDAQSLYAFFIKQLADKLAPKGIQLIVQTPVVADNVFHELSGNEIPSSTQASQILLIEAVTLPSQYPALNAPANNQTTVPAGVVLLFSQSASLHKSNLTPWVQCLWHALPTQ